MQSSYYQKVEDSQREITALRHDLKKHLHSLVVFLKSGQYEEALDYIEQIYQSANGMKVPLSGGNSMVNILVNNAQQQAAASDIPLTANIMVPPKLPIENVDLCIILGNLLDNALKYGERARLSLEDGPEAVVLHVDDDGPGVPEQRLEQIFEPRFRLSPRGQGYGLGLGIARDIAEACGGRLSLEDSPLGGLRVSVELPLQKSGRAARA